MDVVEFYNKIFGIKRCYEYQKETWQKINKNKFPLLIKAPTGSGKTESILAPFLNQFIENKFILAPRMIYVLPTRVLVNSTAERIKKYAQKISPYILVKVQHGDVPNSPFFIADIVVTTLDQFLYAFARTSKQVGHHIDVPAGAIASSIVIFDEAHMYRDEFTFSITRALMEILYQSNIPFIVMTATMPESLENSLFENIPLTNEQKIFGYLPAKSSLRIKIKNESLISNGEVNLSDRMLRKIKSKKTLIVLNQVKKAQKVYEEIKKRLNLKHGEIILLHSRFTRSDRETHEREALSIIPHKENGKIRLSEGVGIVISTQVLEAGIDFSAELLITELAPADSLIQRAGRCARYEGEKGEMIIFQVDMENKGYLPYKKEHLEKTLNWLKNHKEFNIKDFNHVSAFINETLDYRANDFEARDTLIDLYECVLYADNKPQNIQLREGKPITLLVVDVSIGEGKKKEEKIKDALRKTSLRENSIDGDIKLGWKLLEERKLRYRLDFQDEKWTPVEIKDILPFKYYLLEKDYYDSYKGVILDVEPYVI